MIFSKLLIIILIKYKIPIEICCVMCYNSKEYKEEFYYDWANY